MRAYYNDHDKNVCLWLEQLIKNGDITKGHVDDRSITEIKPDDIAGYDRVHFFAGIGAWDYALNCAEWGDRPVWTASLPCQPFSSAGKGRGKEDERHLLPQFLELVRQCKPKTIFGEQVERAIGSAGIRNQVQDLQSLQTRAAYLRVLAELQRQGGKTLQELQSMGEEQQAWKEGKEFSDLSKLESTESRRGISKYCPLSIQRKGDGFGYNCGMGSNKDRCRGLRGDRDTFRHSHAESLECAIIGQDRQQQRLHNDEYSCGDLCPECDDEYLGTAEDIGGIEWNNESAQKILDISYRKANEQVERAIGHGWLDDLQANMEAEGYAVGHCVLGAHSVNAAHIRQRLYWVAHAEIERDMRATSPECTQAERQIGNDLHIGIRAGGLFGRVAHSESERCREAWPSGLRSDERESGIGGVGNPKIGAFRSRNGESIPSNEQQEQAGGSDISGWLGNTECPRSEGHARHENSVCEQGWDGKESAGSTDEAGCYGRMADTENNRLKPQQDKQSASIFGKTNDEEELLVRPGALRSTSIEWIWCRDNKYRPVKSGSIKMAHGLTRRMVCCCDSGHEVKEEKVNATEHKTDPREVLPKLRQENVSKEDKFQTRGFVSFQEAKVLQQGLHGESLRGEDKEIEQQEQPQTISESGDEVLSGMWKDNHSSCASCGRKSFKQLAREFDDVVFKVSQGGAFSEFFCAESSHQLQVLSEASDEEWSLLDSQYPLSEIWQSIDEKTKNRVRMGFKRGCWLMSSRINPLVNKESVHSNYTSTPIEANNTQEARAMRLKGYGNAIQADTAIAFIRAFMSV